VIVHDGLGRRDGRETVDKLNWPPARRSACSRCACTAVPDTEAFVAALPPTVRSIAVLDRTKEPGAAGEPLYQDVIAALPRRWPGPATDAAVIGGRYGLSSKEFTPAMAKAVFDELGQPRPSATSPSASSTT
jgi:pyruvate-ferredoxin/flavodoxin oxidoreductase